MSFFIMYLLMVLGSIQGWMFGLTIVLCSMSAITIFFRGCLWMDHHDVKVFNGPVKWMGGAALVLSLLVSLIPSKQDMAIIAAGGITYNAVTSDTAKELGGKATLLLNKKLELMLEDPVEAVKDAKKVVDEVSKK